MKLIIDIPNEDYKFIKELQSYYPGRRSGKTIEQNVINGIRSGIPLPKGQGRLIILSENAIKREQMPLSFSCQNWISDVGLSNATVTIIEADKEAENDNL